MKLSKFPGGVQKPLQARRVLQPLARHACCSALVLAFGCTDARTTDKLPRLDAGSQPTTVVEAGPTTVNPARDAAVSSQGTTSRPGDAAVTTTTDVTKIDADVDPTEAGLTSSVVTSTQPPDAGQQSVGSNADADASGPVEPSVCESLPVAPLGFFAQYGFEQSEDFAFDEHGNYVGVDMNGNLVRISDVGRRELWAPNIARTTAGMSILPDGSVVVCDVGEGSIKRIYENGYSETVLAGLEYPNGLDIGPDGFIYVAENNAGRVRRIDPDTGDFTIVAIGLFGPNGVAFGDDPSIMYIGSFEGSGVYRVDIPAPGELGQASVLARPNGSDMPEPRLACPDQVEGRDCHMGFAHGTPGKCQRVANVVDCFRYDRCPDLDEGSACDYPVYGICTDGVCTAPCADAEPWDTCDLPNEEGAGVCAPQFDESLECRPPSPCDQLTEGDACAIDDVEGTCQVVSEYYYYGEYGGLYCDVPGPCADKEEGDECTTDGNTGVCQDFGDDELSCAPAPPCDGKSEGDACEPWPEAEGVCSDEGYGLECNFVNPCEGQEHGAACESPYSGLPGTCRVYDYGEYTESYCQEIEPCEGLDVGEACVGYDGPGTCVQTGGWSLYCEAEPCGDLEEGDTCYSAVSGQGTCVDTDGVLSCYIPPPCEDKEEGASCTLSYYEYGTCTEGEDGLFCQPPLPCEGNVEGDFCYTDDGEGYCSTVGETLECVVPCAGLNEGDVCQLSDGPGVCTDQGGYLNCQVPNPCANLGEGDACSASFGAGTCVRTDSNNPYPYPYPYYWDQADAPLITPVTLSGPALALTVDGGVDGGLDGGAYTDAAPGVDAGAYTDASPGTSTGVAMDSGVEWVDAQAPTFPVADAGYYPWPSYDAGSPWPSYDGGYYPEPEPTYECLPSGDCSTLPDGAACATQNHQLGACFIGKCYADEGPGGIDGMGVDMCGNVYAAEYIVGNVWRIAPDGTTELLTKLPSSWIPNIKWGRGVGGFERDIMYIADRNEGRLFGVRVGVPGATEFYDIGNP